jgi:hypothetical protein
MLQFQAPGFTAPMPYNNVMTPEAVAALPKLARTVETQTPKIAGLGSLKEAAAMVVGDVGGTASIISIGSGVDSIDARSSNPSDARAHVGDHGSSRIRSGISPPPPPDDIGQCAQANP